MAAGDAAEVAVVVAPSVGLAAEVAPGVTEAPVVADGEAAEVALGRTELVGAVPLGTILAVIDCI